MKSQVLAVALLGAAALLTGQARAGTLETINFDNLGDFVTVTNQYANVVFSAMGTGEVVLTTSQNPPYLGSPPNLICTGVSGGPLDCTHDLILTFSAPVDNLTFDAFGNQTPAPGTFALADVFQNFSATATVTNIPLTVSHTTHCTAPTSDCAADPQSLPYLGITQVVVHESAFEIVNMGTAFDNFSFTVEQTAPPDTPEPSTLFLTGLCGIVWAGHRFLTRKSM